MDTISKLRFWCYKILPLVYDDSLSYYEVICKATQKLNEVIGNVNELPDYINKEIAEQIGNNGDLFERLFSKILKAIVTCVDDTEFTSDEKFGGEIFWHNGELVECVKHMDIGTNYVMGTNIETVDIIGLLNDIRSYISTKTEKYNERADRDIVAGEYLFWKDKFLKAKQTIANDTVLTDDMFEEVHIGDELKNETDARIATDKALKNDITNETTDRKNNDNKLNNDIIRNKALLDNLQNIPEGSTTSDAALNAIKTDYTNVTHNTPVDGVNNGDIKVLASSSYAIDEFKKFSDLNVNLFDKTSLSKVGGYYEQYDGAIKDGHGYNISGPIFVKKGITYKYNFSSLLGNNTAVFYCDEQGAIFSKTKIDGNVSDGFNVFTPSFSGLIVFNVPDNIINSCMFCEADKWPNTYVEFKNNTNERIASSFNKSNATRVDLSNIITQANLANENTMTFGYLNNGHLIDNADYKTTDFIPIYNTHYVKNSNDISFGNDAAYVFLYATKSDDSYLGFIRGTKLEANWYTVDLTNSTASYCKLSYRKNQDAYFGIGTIKPESIPSSAKFLAKDINVLSSNIVGGSYSPLKGKVWYVLGDSATHGDFTSITQPNIPDGLYAGKLPVYPYFIGNRTEMIVHNNARNGAVLTTLDESHTNYSFTKNNNFINDVGNDADYITIWLGANDMWQHAEIGTINDTEATTFYGAWNVILKYLVTNFPNAKLGTVASFWCTKEYAECAINVSKKYGVPCLNLYNDPTVPITVGSNRPDIPASIRNIRNAQWVVSPTNSHPSAKYHEIESYFIENWLLSL